MFRNILPSLLLLLGVAFAGLTLAADEPTLHQVYEAANAGRLSEAQGMMDKVLRDHPGSAKAHYVEAEILARQGHLAGAREEFGTAERLDPGLPFAKPESVEKLRRHLDAGQAPAQLASGVGSVAPVALPRAAAGIPWAMLLMGLGLIAAIVFFVRSLARRNNSVLPAAGRPSFGGGFGAGAPMQPYGAGGVAQPMGMGTGAGGIGSGILGGLATGAAVGAGMVAGEALMHHFTEGNRQEVNQQPLTAPKDDWGSAPDDLGGSDFGVSDGASWDDGSSGGDWN